VVGAEQAPVRAGDISVRLLRQDDLQTADRIARLAFGTFLGLPDPLTFMGDADYVGTRWRADPAAAFAAEAGGELVGSNLAANWGSFGFFGPLTVRPDLWDRGIAGRLLEPTMALFERWGTRHAGLFTFAHSPKHHGLYQKFGFWPRFLTPIMSKPVAGTRHATEWSRHSDVPEPERSSCLDACRQLTDAIYDGLDLEREILAVDNQGLGDTILLWDGSKLAGLAVCHCGPNTEAGSGVCYVKFGAARSGPGAADAFERLLDACEAFAATMGLSRLVAGVNTARDDAYRRMLARGFRTDFVGVAMERPAEPGYNRPDVYAVDDWR
jgi:GNAT superfamily N-acetyltransferase